MVTEVTVAITIPRFAFLVMHAAMAASEIEAVSAASEIAIVIIAIIFMLMLAN